MIIKEIHELPDQVFGGGRWRDALKEFGNNCRVVKLDDTAYIIQRGDGKKSWTITTYFTNLAGTEGVVVVYMLSRGPFQIKEVLDSDSYIVERYNSSSTSTRKYKGTELYMLPPALFPHDPVDNMDQRYLNFYHAPMASPLKRTLDIELYNDTYFPTNS